MLYDCMSDRFRSRRAEDPASAGAKSLALADHVRVSKSVYDIGIHMIIMISVAIDGFS